MNLSSLVALWAQHYGVETALERIVGDDASACDALATLGVRVLSHREGEGDRALEAQVDLVVVHGHGTAPAEWQDWLMDLSKRATKLVVVAAPDPAQVRRGRLRRIASRVLGRARPSAHGADGTWGETRVMAPVLWAIGRVREHERVGKGAHAFVVDVTPRTPQARRKLRLASTTG